MKKLLVQVPVLWLACAGPRSLEGTWAGQVSSAGAIPVGVRFALREDAGTLTGQTWVEDPNTHAFLKDATLTGARAGAHATWTTETELKISVDLVGDELVGTLLYPAEDELGLRVSTTILKFVPTAVHALRPAQGKSKRAGAGDA